MKKIAIITFSNSNDNYGQLLQAYALQAYLSNNGHDAVLIDYRPDPWFIIRRNQNLIMAYVKFYVKMFLAYCHIRNSKKTSPDCRNFGEFRSSYLKYYPQIYTSYLELKKNPPLADVYKTGSDQVWHARVGDVSPYMLGFVKGGHKIAYAASLGGDSISSRNASYIYKLLSQYQRIGIREESGVEECKKIGLKNVEYTPDPTVLLTQAQWQTVASVQSPFKTTKKKILVYSCYLPKGKLLETIPENNDCEIIIVDIINHDEKYSLLSINDWIAAIRDADYVITNSFHATMFSLYFNTKFVTFRYDDKAVSKMNSRLDTIANLTDLPERFPSFAKGTDAFEILQSPVDWEKVNKKIRFLQSNGAGFLENNL